MRKPIRPLYVFFFGMVFGAGALYFLSNVSWPKVPAAIPGASAPPVASEPPVLPGTIEPSPKASAPESKSESESVGIPANVIAPEPIQQQMPQEPSLAALLIPVRGIGAAQLSDTFTQARAEGRVHEAIDILSPTGTPVLAVADGRIVKLFDSKPGGLTLYQFDTSETYAYYYAHLNGYAAGIVEGQQVKRGELLGYVGSTGNANPAAPHLHFAIFELGPEKNWWQGKAINPYPLLGGY